MRNLPKMLSKREIELEELKEAKYVQSLRHDIEKLQEQLNTAKKALINIKLRYFWSLPRGVSPRLECGHALALSSRAVPAVSRSPPRGAKDLWFSLESFP